MAFDVAGFTALYGYSPQEYVNRVAVRTALAPTLAAAQAELAADKAKLVPGGWEHLTDLEAMQAGATAESTYLNQVSIVKGLVTRQEAAKAFAAGTMAFGAFRSYLGNEANQLIDAGYGAFIDGDLVKAAVVAALG